MRHIISILLENEPGALSRVSGLFSARGYNIESLTVAPTEDATLSRMTIVTNGSEEIVEQITKQLNKLIEVVKVVDLSDGLLADVADRMCLHARELTIERPGRKPLTVTAPLPKHMKNAFKDLGFTEGDSNA